MVLIAIALGIGLSSGCAARRTIVNDYGVTRCPAEAAGDLLSVDALQCWFAASHGRWRTLSQESHYDVLVVQVEALELGDADEIARRFVAGESRRFSEILIYAQPESHARSTRIRRIRWTRESGFEVLEFTAPDTR